MNMSPGSAVAASILMLLMTRFLFWARLGSHQSRKARKRYKEIGRASCRERV